MQAVLIMQNQKQETAQSESGRKSLETELANLRKQLELQVSSLITVQSKHDDLQTELAALQKDSLANSEAAKQTLSATGAMDVKIIDA